MNPVMHLSNHINIFLSFDLHLQISIYFLTFMHIDFVFPYWNQYLECLLKKIGRQMDAEGKNGIDKNMFYILIFSKSKVLLICNFP